MTETLSDHEIESRLTRLAWEREGDEIVREWRFEDFSEAIAFVNRVAEEWRPTITLTSSSTGGTR
jgi:pterin-4a-carbinolamine dehydratase